MTKVITYGTYDLLHYGHIRLLERAKALGDYLIVGVTADDFDIARGKINVQQTLLERVEAVRATGLADEIIVEEYEGQKIDDVQKYDIDIFTVGSDWVGKFDYLNQYCNVVYLDRTQGVSSTELRSKKADLRIGLVGESRVVNKFACECDYVDGATPIGIWTLNDAMQSSGLETVLRYDSFESLIEASDALYIASHPSRHYEQIKYALQHKRHVIYESPLTLDVNQAAELFDLADANGVVLYAGIKTAYSTAYSRMILMAKTGKIGDIVSVDSVCTSLSVSEDTQIEMLDNVWNSLCSWGPTAMLPIFQLLGVDYISNQMWSKTLSAKPDFDLFTKSDFQYPDAVASFKVGKGVKSEGQLVITGSQGYVIVPAPWWKTDYFEIRFEDQNQNRRFFYQIEGEGIRNMISSFVKSVNQHKIAYVKKEVSLAIVRAISLFYKKRKLE